MPSLNQFEVAEWLRGKRDRYRLTKFLLGMWHNRLPRLLGWNLSPLRLLFGLLRLLGFFAVVLTPLLLKLIDGKSTLSWQEVAWLSGAILLIQSYNYLHDMIVRNAKERGTRRRLLRNLSLEVAAIVSILAPAVVLRRNEFQPQIDEAKRRLLQCILRVIQIHVTDYEGLYLEVTLLLFHDHDLTQILIADRATNQRQKGIITLSHETIAHHVAKSGRHRVITISRRTIISSRREVFRPLWLLIEASCSSLCLTGSRANAIIALG
jgi:hypothetical protein